MVFLKEAGNPKVVSMQTRKRTASEPSAAPIRRISRLNPLNDDNVYRALTRARIQSSKVKKQHLAQLWLPAKIMLALVYPGQT